MSSYVVLARKWRPAQFKDIVGQGPVIRTLMNAIRAERIHQAYLFTGSRGIGKTSIARIFSKVVRCEKTEWRKEDSGEWLQSCDHCSSCEEITQSRSVDVIEIDGASNNGVDHVREIRENAKYLPASGNRKIYIIDEVHMLSTQAFNALLKTLEEPPAHVIFVFATTEPHKIPPTILSRVQRFDLRRVTMAQIQARLTEVAAAEGLQAEPGALALIARAAEGGMRDALSLLDQVIAFSGREITLQTVRDSIGLIESQAVLGILHGIFARKTSDALGRIAEAYQQGHDLKVLTRNIVEFLHGAILAKVGASDSHLLELSENEWSELKSIAALRPLEELEIIFQIFHQGLEWIARSPQPKILLDVIAVKCATAEALIQVNSPGGSASSPQPSNSKIPTPSISSATSAAPGSSLSSSPVPGPAPSPAPSPAQRSAFSWEGLIEKVRLNRPLLASVLEHGSCAQLPQSAEPGKNALVLHYRTEDSYYRDQLQSRVYSEQFAALCKDYFGFQSIPRIELMDGAQAQAGSPSESIAARKERLAKEHEKNAREAALNHPIIREAQALFGGDLGPIEILGGAGETRGAI